MLKHFSILSYFLAVPFFYIHSVLTKASVVILHSVLGAAVKEKIVPICMIQQEFNRNKQRSTIQHLGGNSGNFLSVSPEQVMESPYLVVFQNYLMTRG